jgi:Ca2+/H+ antiporter, TMEM165/GDT1 family
LLGMSGRVDRLAPTMHPGVAFAVFPVIFIGELPDKTMFASLVLASRARPAFVWFGAAAAFFVHVVIAVTIGVGLFHVLPTWAVETFVAVLFLVGAVLAFREAGNAVEDETKLVDTETSSHPNAIVMSFVVIFIAEWGDLTQILTANLAAKYHSPVSVAVGAVAALWSVALIAVVSGQGLLRRVPVRRLRQITGVVLVLLAMWSAWLAIRN